MGARHSKRSLDVTTTPKKDGLPAEGGDAPVVGDGKLERIEEIDAKPTTNGVAPHIDTPEEKEVKDKDSATEKDNKNDEETKEAEETKADSQAESPTEGGENVTTPTEETHANTTSVSSPETKESKKKDKPKKKWSFRSISFSKKDKNKPVREETPKNGDVSKEEPLTEGGEDGENATATVNGTEEKSAPSSPTESPATPVADAKEDEKPAPLSPSAAATTEASSVDDKNEATKASPSSPIAPTPVPVEAINDEAEKEEVEKKIVEVSPVQAVAAPVEVTTYTQPIVTPSIIERKTSEDFHSLFPSSPPPTPIDPSPLQQAQQTAANADALAEALKLPAQTIKQSQNDPYVADNQKKIDTIESNNESAIIMNLPTVGNVIIDLPQLDEDMSESEEYEDEQEEHSTILLSAVAPQTDLVIQTEEGPIPVSNNDIEIDIESEKNKTDEINAEIIAEIPDIPLEVVEKITNNDHEIVMNNKEIQFVEESCNTKFDDEINAGKIEDDIPPPLPESPVPMPKTTTDLLNFMTSQIEDSQVILNDVINVTSPISTECVTPAVVLPCAPTISNEISSEIELQNKFCNISESSNILLPPQDIENLPLPPSEVAAYEVVQESISLPSESPIESLLTPPRSPSPTLKLNHIVHECASLVINGHDNNTTVNNEKEKNTSSGTRLESVKQNHPVTNNDDTIDIIKERLADTNAKEEENGTTMVTCPLTQHVENDEQSIVESVAAIENIVADNSLSETIEEVTKNVITEAPVSPSLKAPMITEDVASVTKAVEEIDINEKAVAAAVNENIECITKNEIIAEMNHQNNLNE